MPGHFASKSANYYIRTALGKRSYIRFRNGMSLDELARAMSEETKIDVSSLSRMMSGERLPTADQLRIFCAVLDLSEEEEDMLRAAAVLDYGDRIGYDLAVAADPRVVNLLVRNVEQVRSAMDNEEFNRALEMLRDIRRAQLELSAGDTPPAPMMRVVTMMESERKILMDSLAYSALRNSEKIEIVGIAEAYEIMDLLEALNFQVEVGSIGIRYFQEGESAEEIAAAEDLSLATVLSVIEVIKGRLLQDLTGAASTT